MTPASFVEQTNQSLAFAFFTSAAAWGCFFFLSCFLTAGGSALDFFFGTAAVCCGFGSTKMISVAGLKKQKLLSFNKHRSSRQQLLPTSSFRCPGPDFS
jgi:hypothetical protein